MEPSTHTYLFIHSIFCVKTLFFCYVCGQTGVVAMHIESLEPVYREYKNLAPIQKVSNS